MATSLSAHDVPRNLRPWAETALKAGWTITIRKGGHLCWRAPGGGVVFTSTTTRYPRALANSRSHLRRLGLDI